MDPSQSHQPINSASAATPTPAIPRPPELAILVVALSGLPGAGKTSLCRAIAAHVKLRENVSGPRQEQEREKAAFDRGHPSGGAIHAIHIEFDAMMERWRTPGLAAAPTTGHESEDVVRALKSSGGRRIGERKDEKGDWVCDFLVTGGGVVPRKDVPASHIIFLDESSFYKSMKHEVFQMCRRNHAAFLSLHLPIPPAVANARNSQREQILSPTLPHRKSSSAHYVTIARDWDRREQEMEDAERSKTQSRSETAESFLYQLNIRLNRVVGSGDFLRNVRAEIASSEGGEGGESGSWCSLADYVQRFESELQSRGLPL
ncbi:hypothetical protein M427DRAFT_60544 [Gonapodya prolifera JEL478]|uniref:P-loop containing nucleoside triphosphate hydrolase protein n=1 Tax=Gonapodya prolifera (strain JEL478) TaxID=1344416 RepID=A0A139A404_GONPJ|nr:hypothetical protein M427DRAFT_60544 [Gonapodya prolifera JEL478]|eukprot:KXS11520.1 hypothetical protein M427DRAFT_60544 [Gonapodya prolifera JEL478]